MSVGIATASEADTVTARVKARKTDPSPDQKARVLERAQTSHKNHLNGLRGSGERVDRRNEAMG
ncbi:hypothetical protein [Streptomyces sp. NPDC006527]|uniref:hypothetical protein n=1 Tax=Streptomyces sp. NPDC006527 TaxID=3364749 RepID=UPI0036C36434